MRKSLPGVLLVMVTMGLIALSLSPPSEGEEQQPPLGDIEVVNTTANLTANSTIKGNITVMDGGVLKIENCSLEFPEDEGNKFHITVENNSTLEIKDSYIYTTTKRLLDPYLKFKVTLLNSTCAIKNSILAFPGWINATDAHFIMDNSVITNVDPSGSGLDVDRNDDSPLLSFKNCNVTLVNSRIEHYYEASLEEQVFVFNLSNFKVGPNETVNASFLPSNITKVVDKLTAAMLEASYKGEQNYTGTKYLRWRVRGRYKNTTIKPTNSTELTNETYDLFLQGVDRVEELKNLSVMFENKDNNNDNRSDNRSINFTSIRVVFAYNNDLTLINSTLRAINTYLDIDFQQADADPVKNGIQETQDDTYLEDARLDHNALRLLEGSTAYLYNVTVDMSETDGKVPPYGDPVFLVDNTSEGFFYRLLNVKTLDGTQHPLANASVVVTRQYSTEILQPEPSWLLSYLGRNAKNYNVTDSEGVALIPLCSDLITATQWRNGIPVGNYTLNISYSTNQTTYQKLINITLKRFHYITQQDNTPTYNVTFNELKPELSVRLEVSSENPLEGENVTLSATIYNNGTTKAYDVPLVFYDEGTVIPGGNLIIVQIAKGGNVTQKKNLSASATRPHEHHNITVKVDPENKIPELDETNNNYTKSILVHELKPELSVRLEVSPEKTIEGENVTLSATIYNNGTTKAYDVSVVFYDNGVEIPGGNLIIGLISKGGEVTQKVILSASATHLHELRDITVKVDPENNIPELDENNNADVKSILVHRKPDLWLDAESILIQPMEESGKKGISVLVWNTGGRDAENFNVTFCDGKELIGEQVIKNLSAGNYTNISIDWYIRNTGSRDINITVDEEKAVDEFNEKNNQVSTSVDISLDLYPSKIDFSNPYPVAGDNITIYGTVYNSGEVNASCDVEFYAKDDLIGCDRIPTLANRYTTAECSFNTTEYGGEDIELKIKITNSTPIETGELSNKCTTQLLVYTEPYDLVVEKPTFINWDYIHKGNVLIRENGSLIIVNSTVTIYQTADYQYHIVLLGSGKLVLKNSILRSTHTHKLSLMLYENSSLRMLNSTAHAGIIGVGSVAINMEKSTLSGTLQLVGERIRLIDSNLTQNSDISANIAFINNTAFSAPTRINGTEITLTNSVFTEITLLGGKVKVTNTTSKKSILVTGDARLYTYHLLNLGVVDEKLSPLPNATVKIYRMLPKNKALYLSTQTNKNGKAVLKLLTNNTTAYRDRFVGLYNVSVAFGNYTEECRFNISRAKQLQVKIDKILIPPRYLAIKITKITPSKEEVKAGEELTVSIKVLYKFQNTKAPAPNARLKLTIDGKEYLGESDKQGKLELEVKAPKETGVRELKILGEDMVYGLRGTSSKTFYVKKLPKKKLNLVPIAVGVLCAALVGIICYFKRETIKPRLLVLKAKLCREEFMGCSECGKRIPEAFEECPYCGAVFEEELVKCSECGGEIPSTSMRCPKCGAVFEE